MPQIHELMPKIMADLGAIGKTHVTAAAGKYRYRSVEDALNALGPVLVAHGVCTTFAVLEMGTEGRDGLDDKGKPRTIYRTWLRAEVRFHAADGSSLACVGAGEGLDYAGDKSANKAMSAAYKYAVFLGLSVPLADGAAGDADDGPAPIPPPAAPLNFAAAAPQIAPPSQAPAAAQPAAANALIDAETIQKIYNECDRAAVPTQELIAIVHRRGVNRIAELPAAAGAEILAKLSLLPDSISEEPVDAVIPF